MPKSVFRVLLAGALLVPAAGCNEPIPAGRNYTIRRLGGVSQSAALDMAQATLREYDFRIAEVNRRQGYVRSVPNAQTLPGGTGRLRDRALRYPNRVRRTAILAMVTYADAVDLKCRVLMERLDTSDHQAFQRERGTADVPSGTPIEEEAGVSGQQNEVWTPVRRDRVLERQILAAWVERLGGATEESP